MSTVSYLLCNLWTLNKILKPNIWAEKSSFLCRDSNPRGLDGNTKLIHCAMPPPPLRSWHFFGFVTPKSFLWHFDILHKWWISKSKFSLSHKHLKAQRSRFVSECGQVLLWVCVSKCGCAWVSVSVHKWVWVSVQEWVWEGNREKVRKSGKKKVLDWQFKWLLRF